MKNIGRFEECLTFSDILRFQAQHYSGRVWLYDGNTGENHTVKEIDVAIAAVAMGACLIEKYFTLNQNLPGPDHRISIELGDFRQMVQSIRNIELALGDGVKKPRTSEVPMQTIARKSIVAARDIPVGETIKEDMLAIKRPGSGISPLYWNDVIGRIAKSNIVKEQLLTWEHLSLKHSQEFK